jgi:alkylated DNA nucleotide flippase Atl1
MAGCLPARRRVSYHRVVRSDGSVGGYAGGTKKKIEILKREGVAVKGDKIDLEIYNT